LRSAICATRSKRPHGPTVGYRPHRIIYLTGIDANGKVAEGFRAQGVQGADAFASPGAEVDWSCEDQADWSKRVDVAVGGGSGVSHKLYEKTPRKGLAENPRQRAILDAQFPVLKID